MIILPENVFTKRLTRLPLKKSSLIRFEESNIELFVEAAYEDADETADEITIEEIVINSIIEAFIDKIAGGKAILEAAERVEEFTVELSDEAVRVAAERS